MQVSIIIVNYNTLFITEACIDSINKFTKDINYEIILVDNASTDGSKEHFEARKDITYIYSSENLGFGKANNLGATIAKGEFLFFLNSDTLFIENSLFKLINFFCENERKMKIGVLGCTLVDENKEPNGDGGYLPTLKSILIEKYRGLPILNKFLKYKPFVPKFFTDAYFEIGYVLGADMLLRKKLFFEVGGFNPKYFMYYEESEIQHLIRKKGYKNYILKETKIIHLIAKSSTPSQNYSNNKRIMVNQSRIEYLKNKGGLKRYFVFEFIFMILIFFNNKYSFKDNLSYISNILNKIFRDV